MENVYGNVLITYLILYMLFDQNSYVTTKAVATDCIWQKTPQANQQIHFFSVSLQNHSFSFQTVQQNVKKKNIEIILSNLPPQHFILFYFILIYFILVRLKLSTLALYHLIDTWTLA